MVDDGRFLRACREDVVICAHARDIAMDFVIVTKGLKPDVCITQGGRAAARIRWCSRTQESISPALPADAGSPPVAGTGSFPELGVPNTQDTIGYCVQNLRLARKGTEIESSPAACGCFTHK